MMPADAASEEELAATVAARGRRQDPRVAEPLASAPPPDGGPAKIAPLAAGPQIANAEQASARGERGRLRTLAGGMLLWCLTGVPMLVFVPGASSDKWIYAGGLAFVVIGYAVLFVRAGVVTALGRRERLGIAWAVAIGASAITLGAGICSPFTILMAISVMLFALSAPLPEAVSVYAIVALAHLLFGGLAFAEVVTSSGLLDPMGQPDTLSLALSVGWVEVVYATSLGLGVAVNRRFVRLLSELESAVRAAKVRKALLDEARIELDRSSKPGGAGYFTGQTLGSFQLGEIIGRGGMGEVYAAERTEDRAPAAVKLLRRDALSNPGVVHRFEREARIVRGLRSPHIVEVYEVGGREAPFPFIAMERLRGVDLATKLRHADTLSIEDAIALADEVASGLEIAHDAGIIHRDLKPSNLFHALDPSGEERWKILDFGVSKLIGGGDTITANEVVGTPLYMAPEQAAESGACDRRADVYSLSAILYRALTGRPVFAERELIHLLVKVMTTMPEDPQKLAKLPEAMALVLRVGLSKRPDDRFESAKALAEAFKDAAQGRLAKKTAADARHLLGKLPWGATASSAKE